MDGFFGSCRRPKRLGAFYFLSILFFLFSLTSAESHQVYYYTPDQPKGVPSKRVACREIAAMIGHLEGLSKLHYLALLKVLPNNQLKSLDQKILKAIWNEPIQTEYKKTWRTAENKVLTTRRVDVRDQAVREFISRSIFLLKSQDLQTPLLYPSVEAAVASYGLETAEGVLGFRLRNDPTWEAKFAGEKFSSPMEERLELLANQRLPFDPQIQAKVEKWLADRPSNVSFVRELNDLDLYSRYLGDVYRLVQKLQIENEPLIREAFKAAPELENYFRGDDQVMALPPDHPGLNMMGLAIQASLRYLIDRMVRDPEIRSFHPKFFPNDWLFIHPDFQVVVRLNDQQKIHEIDLHFYDDSALIGELPKIEKAVLKARDGNLNQKSALSPKLSESPVSERKPSAPDVVKVEANEKPQKTAATEHQPLYFNGYQLPPLIKDSLEEINLSYPNHRVFLQESVPLALEERPDLLSSDQWTSFAGKISEILDSKADDKEAERRLFRLVERQRTLESSELNRGTPEESESRKKIDPEIPEDQSLEDFIDGTKPVSEIKPGKVYLMRFPHRQDLDPVLQEVVFESKALKFLTEQSDPKVWIKKIKNGVVGESVSGIKPVTMTPDLPWWYELKILSSNYRIGVERYAKKTADNKSICRWYFVEPFRK